MILNEKAKRQEKELNRQIYILQQQQQEKQKELNFLKSTYKLSS